MKLNFCAMAVCGVLAFGTLTACNKNQDNHQNNKAMQKMPDPTVQVQVVSLDDIPIGKTFAGRISASESSQVRPQVSGYVDEILFQEGTQVKAGQPLYRINVDSYKSSVASKEALVNQAYANVGTAKANLISQRANLEQAQADLQRLDGLLEVNAISQQTYDRAITAFKTAQASVEQAQANLASSEESVRASEASLSASRLDLDRTIVRAPISGKAGISSVSKGALVSAGQAVPLVTISRLNPVFVDISQSSAELLKLRQAIASGQSAVGTSQVQLVLDGGVVYPELGQIVMDNAVVDEATGAITLRAVVPNPYSILLPGMYVDANLRQTVALDAMLLPQSAVMRTPTGDAQVYIVNNQKIEVRQVSVSGTHDGQWVVTGGLKNGDQVVVMGGAKVKPEQTVQVQIVSPNTNANTPPQNQPNTQIAPTAKVGQNTVMAPNPPPPTSSASKPQVKSLDNLPTSSSADVSIEEQQAMAAAD